MTTGVNLMPVTTDCDKDRRVGRVQLNRTVTGIFVLLAFLSGPRMAGSSPWHPVAWQPSQLRLLGAPSVLLLAEPELTQGKFLVASRQLKDPGFRKSVVLVIDCDKRGALGLIINRPTEVRLSEVLPEIEELQERTDNLYLGGPVGMTDVRLLVQTDSPPRDSHHVFADIYVSSSGGLLQRLVKNRAAAERFRVYAGYAGWAPGQLEGEIARGDWHILDGDPEVIFDLPASRIWPELIQRTSVLWVKASGIRANDY